MNYIIVSYVIPYYIIFIIIIIIIDFSLSLSLPFSMYIYIYIYIICMYRCCRCRWPSRRSPEGARSPYIIY